MQCSNSQDQRLDKCTSYKWQDKLGIFHLFKHLFILIHIWNKGEVGTIKIVSEYDQEIPQSQTADNPMAP